MKNKNLALAGALLLAVCFSAEGSSFMARFCAAGDAAFLQSPVAPLVKKTTSFRRVIIIGSAAVLGIAAALGLWWYMRAEPEPAPEPGPEPGPVVNPEPVPVMAPPPLTRVDFPLYGREFPGYSHQGYVIWGMNVCQFFTNDADGSSLFVLTRQNVARDFAEAFNAVDQALFGSTGSHIQHATAVYLDEYDTAQVVTPLPAGVTKVRRLAGVIAASRQPMSFEERKAIARQLLELIEQVNLPGDAPYCGITIFDHILVERTPTEIAVTWIPEISKVAAITTAQASSQTSNGFQISAPEVMAEEDPRQEKVEIFMLGLYLYQLLTGKSFAAGYGGKSHQLNQDIANGVISQRIADEISMLAPLVRMNPMERELTGLAQALAAYNP